MRSRMRSRAGPAVALALLALSVLGLSGRPVPPLRVCADPNNLPFSNRQREGFENRIATLLADELGAPLEYSWTAEWRGLVRKTLGAGRCDLLMGMPAAAEGVPDVAAGMLFGVVTDTLPEPAATEAPVPGTEAVTAGTTTGTGTGSGGIGSSTPVDGMSPDMSTSAMAPPALALRPAAEAVTVGLLGRDFPDAGVPT